MDFQSLEIATKRLSDINYLYGLIIDAVDQHTSILINLVKGQIRVGVKGDGSRTLKYVDDGSRFNPNRYVARVKKTPAPQMPFRNYENEGDFLGGMFAFAKSTEIFIGSDDSKSRFIEDEEGDELFGLTDENKVVFADYWVPTFLKLIEDDLFR